MNRFVTIFLAGLVSGCVSGGQSEGEPYGLSDPLRITDTDAMVARVFSDGMQWHFASSVYPPAFHALEGTVISVHGNRVLISSDASTFPYRSMFAMELYSGGSYKGQVVILRSTPSVLVGYLTRTIEGMAICVGDLATTHF